MFQKVNNVIRAYIYWDFLINAAWGLLSPVFTIFILEKVTQGNVVESAKVAGFAALCYWVTKSILQIPIAHYLDKNHGEIDDFYFYLVGTIITGFVPFFYLFTYYAWHIYVLQVLHAIGMSMIIPASYAIFIRHTDKGKEAYESGLDSTILGIGVGITGAIGGIIAGYLGFQLIFILTGLFTFASVPLIYSMKSSMLPKVPRNVHEYPTGNQTIQ